MNTKKLVAHQFYQNSQLYLKIKILKLTNKIILKESIKNNFVLANNILSAVKITNLLRIYKLIFLNLF